MFQLGYLLPGFRFRARILPETYSSGGAKYNAAIIRVNGMKRHLNQHILHSFLVLRLPFHFKISLFYLNQRFLDLSLLFLLGQALVDQLHHPTRPHQER